MLKNLVVFFIGFFLLVAINFYFVFKTSNALKKQANINRILNEIAQNNSPQKQFNHSSAPFVLGAYEAEFKMADGRSANLRNFFRKYNSPLYDYAELIVAVSDQYQFDYRLLPAIAMQESNLCRVIPENSYNCWGWGIYGSTITRFSSYEEAIRTVARGIKKDYIDKGLVTASSIMSKYTPSSNGSWAYGVNTFLRMLE